MSTLTGRTPQNTYKGLLKLRDDANTLSPVEMGNGVPTSLKLSKTKIEINGMAWPTNAPVAGHVLTVGQDSKTLTWAAPSVSGGSGSSTTLAKGFPIDVMASIYGAVTASYVAIRLNVVRDFTVSSASAIASTGATGDVVFTLMRNGVEVGSILFVSGDTDRIVLPLNVNFLAGDVLELVGQEAVDATLADVDFSLKATYR